jgi:hypothetical protein
MGHMHQTGYTKRTWNKQHMRHIQDEWRCAACGTRAAYTAHTGYRTHDEVGHNQHKGYVQKQHHTPHTGHTNEMGHNQHAGYIQCEPYIQYKGHIERRFTRSIPSRVECEKPAARAGL